MKRTIMVNDWKKIEITDEEMVQYFEKMGGRWVALGAAESWSKELIDELGE